MDARAWQMMGMPAIKRSGKMVGGFSNGEGAMVFKLTFDPSGGRRAPMKEWVVVPATGAGKWPDLAEKALGYSWHSSI